MVARNWRTRKRPRLKKRPRPAMRSEKTVWSYECADDLTALAARISTTID
jgi:hypothetical protein